MEEGFLPVGVNTDLKFYRYKQGCCKFLHFGSLTKSYLEIQALISSFSYPSGIYYKPLIVIEID